MSEYQRNSDEKHSKQQIDPQKLLLILGLVVFGLISVSAYLFIKSGKYTQVQQVITTLVNNAQSQQSYSGSGYYTPPKGDIFENYEASWEKPSPKVESLLLINPPQNENGQYTEEGAEILLSLLRGFADFLPPEVGLVRSSQATGWYTFQLEEPVTDNYKHVDIHYEDFIASLAPTHILKGSYIKTDDKLELQMTLETPGNAFDEIFHVGAEEDLLIAANVANWVQGIVKWDINPDDIPVFSNPAYGPDILSRQNPIFDKLEEEFTPGEIFEWASSRIDYLPPQFEANALLRDKEEFDLAEKHLKQMQEAHPGHFRGDWMEYQLASDRNQDARARQALIRTIVKQPGYQAAGAALCYSAWNKDERNTAYVENVREWHSRTYQCPVTDAWLGVALSDAAYFYRGEGYGSTVSPESWRIFREYSTEAVKLLEACLAVGAKVPWIYDKLVKIDGSALGRNNIIRYHNECAKRYPEYPAITTSTIHFMRPRWGGSRDHREALDIIDKSLNNGLQHYKVATLPWTYHATEAWLLVNEEGTLHAALAEYFKRVPRARAQIERGMKQYELIDADYSRRYRFGVESLLPGGMERLREYCREHKDLYEWIIPAFSIHDKYRLLHDRVTVAYLLEGDWATFLEADQFFQQWVSDKGVHHPCDPLVHERFYPFAWFFLGETEKVRRDLDRNFIRRDNINQWYHITLCYLMDYNIEKANEWIDDRIVREAPSEQEKLYKRFAMTLRRARDGEQEEAKADLEQILQEAIEEEDWRLSIYQEVGNRWDEYFSDTR